MALRLPDDAEPSGGFSDDEPFGRDSRWSRRSLHADDGYRAVFSPGSIHTMHTLRGRSVSTERRLSNTVYPAGVPIGQASWAHYGATDSEDEQHRRFGRAAVALEVLPPPGHAAPFFDRHPFLGCAVKLLVVFAASVAVLYVTIATLLPPVDEAHRPALKLPKNLDDLKALNEILQIYKAGYIVQLTVVFTVLYIFLQVFCVPGSMYLSMLGGALFGALPATLLICICVATGALGCYGLSMLFGPPVVANSATWTGRLDRWAGTVAAHEQNLLSYLIVMRISPLPPHWILNIIAPHLGIGPGKFWFSTFVGISGMSYIHAQIGTTIDQLASSDDFRILSWSNALALGGIALAVLVPVLLRRLWKTDMEPVEDVGHFGRRTDGYEPLRAEP